MGKSFFKNTVTTFYLNSRTTFSKKYPKKRVEDILKIDPDYLLYIYKLGKFSFAKEVTDKLDAFATSKERRGITKVTCFK